VSKAQSLLAGRLIAHGEPVAHGEVATFSGEPATATAISRTDIDGRFSLPVAGGPATIVARSLSGRLGLSATPAAALQPNGDLEVPGPWHDLTIVVHTPPGDAHPDRLEAWLDPVRPDLPRTFAVQGRGGARRSHFATVSLSKPTTRLAIQAGEWLIGAAFIVSERAMTVQPSFKNYVAARAIAGESELEGDAWSGFRLTVAGSASVDLELREVADTELL